jgi:hypothetical protein
VNNRVALDFDCWLELEAGLVDVVDEEDGDDDDDGDGEGDDELAAVNCVIEMPKMITSDMAVVVVVGCDINNVRLMLLRSNRVFLNDKNVRRASSSAY